MVAGKGNGGGTAEEGEVDALGRPVPTTGELEGIGLTARPFISKALVCEFGWPTVGGVSSRRGSVGSALAAGSLIDVISPPSCKPI